MGKRFNKKKSKSRSIRQDRSANQNRQEISEKSQKAGYEILDRHNKNFEQYYEVQKFVPVDEWKDFLQCLKVDLPVAFRFTGFKTHVEALKKILNQLKCEAVKEESEKKLQIHPLPWYPDSLGWQLNLTRKEVRRVESFKNLHKFLMSETETGNISRQEAVSMIPPLILNVQPCHKVLDMCAAPGSKTAQIIEFLHRGSDSTIPSGIVVANDADNKRCYMLTHQAKRLQSPTLLITNHDATLLPNIHYKNKDNVLQALKFDRILCDVPCSGDGTLRKNFDVWSKWNAVNGANLHGLQFRIVRRGLELLEVGGRLVYSTCSFNPLENEAVVNRLLQEFESCIELLDVKDELPGLKIVNGLEEWSVINRNLDIIKSPEEIPTESLNYIHKLMFPPSPEEKVKRNLSRCIRILPHHQNTGGFFVAVLTKLKPLPGEKIIEKKENDHQQCANVTTIGTGNPDNVYRRPKKRRCRGYKEEPFFYFESDREEWKMLQDYYGISRDIDGSHFLTRTSDGKGKNIYFTNALIKDIMVHNEDRIKVINTGVKLFVKCENKGASCHYRLSQEGAHVLLPYISRRKLKVKKEDLLSLLLNDDSEFPPQIINLHQETQNQCLTLDCGSVLFVYEEENSCEEFPLSLYLVGWKGKNSVRCYVAKNERSHFLRLLGYEAQKSQEEG